MAGRLLEHTIIGVVMLTYLLMVKSVQGRMGDQSCRRGIRGCQEEMMVEVMVFKEF